jgi:hypothetical protein
MWWRVALRISLTKKIEYLLLCITSAFSEKNNELLELGKLKCTISMYLNKQKSFTDEKFQIINFID